MRVLLAAHDVGPSKAFRLIAYALKDAALPFILDGGRNAYLETDLEQALKDADIALIGMSSPERNATFEISVAEQMHAAGKPFVLFADTLGGWNRGWFRPLRQSARAVFVSTEQERKPASKAFWGVQTYALGNPAWDSYFDPVPRSGVRKCLNYGENERIILSPGTKDVVVNSLLWATTLETVRDYLVDARVVLAPHPGDTTDRAAYERLIAMSGVHRAELLKREVSSDEVVPAASVVVHAGNSSVGLHALCRGIPVVDCPAPFMDAYIARETGGWEYTPYAFGATWHPSSSDFSYSLKEKAPRKKGVFVTQRPGESAQSIAEMLQRLATV